MSCENTTAPVDIKQSYQLCKDLCSYSFQYNANSSCTIVNKGDYLEIKTDGPDKIMFNKVPMQIASVRLYQPSLHSFGGSPADAELIIQHSTNAGSNVLVCRPIKASGSAGSSADFFSQFIPHVSDTSGGTTQVNVTKWSLNDVIPYGASFYYYLGPFPYPPCTSGVQGNSIIVYGADNAAVMNSSDMKTLQSLIDPSTPLAVVSNPTSALLYNGSGAENIADATSSSADKYDIYFDCDPITGVGDEGGEPGSISSITEPHEKHIGKSFEKFAKSPEGIFVWIILGLFIIWLFSYYLVGPLAQKVRRSLGGNPGRIAS